MVGGTTECHNSIMDYGGTRGRVLILSTNRNKLAHLFSPATVTKDIGISEMVVGNERNAIDLFLF